MLCYARLLYECEILVCGPELHLSILRYFFQGIATSLNSGGFMSRFLFLYPKRIDSDLKGFILMRHFLHQVLSIVRVDCLKD